jgi:hypothetical protein
MCLGEAVSAEVFLQAALWLSDWRLRTGENELRPAPTLFGALVARLVG